MVHGRRFNKNSLYVLAAVVALSLYFYYKDVQGLFLFYIFAPIAGVFLYAAIKSKHITLSLFCTFFFVAHAISPAFFFLNKDKYTYSGWAAVKNFNFEMQEFLSIYLWLLGLITCIVVSTLLLSRSRLFYIPRTWHYIAVNMNATQLRTTNVYRNRIIYSFLLTGFIIFLATPLSIYMYNHQIGITGIIPPTLPYKLTGALYYTKRYVVPIVIFILYLRSTRSILLSMLVLLYSLIAGLTSASRSAVIIASLTVLWFSFAERRLLRLMTSLFIVSFGVSVVSLSRSILYAEVPDFLSLIRNSYLLPGKLWELPFEVLNMVSKRLYGAQDIVLAYQYDPGNQIASIIKFFLAKPLEENYALALYGFNLPAGKAYGVGFGLLPWLIALANKSVAVLILLGSIVSIYLSVSERIIRSVLVTRGSVFKIPLNLTGYPLSFLITYSLYGSNLRFFYFFILLSLLIVLKGKKVKLYRHVYQSGAYRRRV